LLKAIEIQLRNEEKNKSMAHVNGTGGGKQGGNGSDPAKSTAQGVGKAQGKKG
jgi:hypothetical protein